MNSAGRISLEENLCALRDNIADQSHVLVTPQKYGDNVIVILRSTVSCNPIEAAVSRERSIGLTLVICDMLASTHRRQFYHHLHRQTRLLQQQKSVDFIVYTPPEDSYHC